MNTTSITDCFARVDDWDRRRIHGERVRRLLWTAAPIFLIAVGFTLVFARAAIGPRWSSVGVVLVLGGVLTGMIPILREELLRLQRQRNRSSLPGSRSNKPPSLVQSPPSSDPHSEADSFVRMIAGLDVKQWTEIVAASQTSEALGPIRTPLLAVDLHRVALERTTKLDGRRAGLNRGRRGGAEKELQRILGDLLTPERGDEFERARRRLDQLVEDGGIPFTPPYAEYRLALAGLHAIHAADVLPENCRRLFRPFDEVLQTDFVSTLCGGAVAELRADEAGGKKR